LRSHNRNIHPRVDVKRAAQNSAPRTLVYCDDRDEPVTTPAGEFGFGRDELPASASATGRASGRHCPAVGDLAGVVDDSDLAAAFFADELACTGYCCGLCVRVDRRAQVVVFDDVPAAGCVLLYESCSWHLESFPASRGALWLR
jgi:hypothetical protein